MSRGAGWTVEQKRLIVEETSGASVSVVARRYDINANLLFKWKREAEAGHLGGALATAAVADLVPIGVVGRGPDGAPTLLASMPGDGNGLRPREPCRSAEIGGAGGRDRDRPAVRHPGSGRCRGRCAGAGAGARRAEAARMIQVAPGTKVYLACRPVSMRYGFDGLSAKVASVLARDPFSGQLFCFAASAVTT